MDSMSLILIQFNVSNYITWSIIGQLSSQSNRPKFTIIKELNFALKILFILSQQTNHKCRYTLVWFKVWAYNNWWSKIIHMWFDFKWFWFEIIEMPVYKYISIKRQVIIFFDIVSAPSTKRVQLVYTCIYCMTNMWPFFHCR